MLPATAGTNFTGWKKWPPREAIEARDMKFCIWSCMTNSHAILKFD